MAVHAGPPATICCEPRQVRKEATVATDSCAGSRAGVGCHPLFNYAAVVTSTSELTSAKVAFWAEDGMGYQVLARKWRPRIFKEMVGQEHVLRALINALDNARLHHAYLFTGTRGVGKTTIARIFAKSLNCELGVRSEPCGTCTACREVDEGRFIDLLEVDAASRTKVEDTRELLENVQYAPTRGRYKVYLIDEVHMLSTHSFNALLKTLEEPPPHIKFLLATTDPQRLPVTILSRCLQFNLKRLPQVQIANHLAHILATENIDFEPVAIQQLARAGDGSMRDALSLLDQAIAYGGGKVTAGEVNAMLGTIEPRHVLDIAAALAEGNAAGVMQAVAELAEQSPSFGNVLEDLLSLLHRIALLQHLPGSNDQGLWNEAAVQQLATKISPEDVQLFYQIGLVGRRDLPLAPDARSGAEMVLLRMLAFRPAVMKLADNTHSQPLQAGRASANSSLPEQAAKVQMSRPAVSPPAVSQTNEVTASYIAEVSGSIGQTAATLDWARVIGEVRLDGLVRQLAMNVAVKEWDGKTLHLKLAPQHGSLRGNKIEERLQQGLERYFQRPIKLIISMESAAGDTPAEEIQRRDQDRYQAAKQAIESDPKVQSLIETFNAKIIPDSIKPRD